MSFRPYLNTRCWSAGETGAGVGDECRVEVADDDAGPFSLRSRIVPRGRSASAVAMRLAPVLVMPALADRQHVALVLDCPGAQQDLPVGAAGGFGKGSRNHQQVDFAQPPVQLGKTQVVADRQPDPRKRRVSKATGTWPGSIVALSLALAILLETEQVNLVVAATRRPSGAKTRVVFSTLSGAFAASGSDPPSSQMP